MKLIRKFAIYGASLSVLTLLCIAFLGTTHPGHAAASNYAADLNCTDSSTEFNVVVVARVYDYLGNLKGYANNYTFHVNAFETNLAYRDKRANGTWKPWVYYDSRSGDMGYPSGHDQYSNETIAWQDMKSEAIRLWDGGYYSHTGVNADFAVQMDSNYVTGALSGSGMASGKGNACQVGTTMVPTYAFRDGDNTHHVTLSTANSYGAAANYPNKVWVGTEDLNHVGNNNSWSLSCLGQTDNSSPIRHMYFSFTQTGWDYSYVINAQSYSSRQSARTGGYWTNPAPLYADNGTSVTTYMDYHEPAPPVVSTSTSIDGTDVEEGQPFTARAGLANGSGATATGVGALWDVWLDKTNNATYDAGDLRLGAPAISGLTLNPGNSYNGVFSNTALSGYSYVCTRLYNFTSSNGTIFSPNPLPVVCHPIIRKPYFQVLRGDANAAASLTTAAGCTSNTLSPISAYNKANAPTYTGSGAQIAVFAAGLITEFTSGVAPKGLTFANTGPVGSQGTTTYGGGFLDTYCIPDYWGAAAATNQTVDASTGTVVTNGDVFITGSPNNSLASFGMGTIPLRWIVANNIYISSGVSYLEGNYIAKGKIYTCATGIGAPVPIASMASSCGTPLTVSGTFIAGSGVKLQRTFGTLSNIVPAETFVYSPDVWMQAIAPNSNVPASAQGTTGKYDSVTLLPPVL